ncbi:MAG: o-succinylbenzoate synthase, partial [Prevotella sp.]|nr:o-succinylbenzoate synthase [Prevotella sp.]
MKYEIEKRTLHFKQPAGTSRGVYTTRKIWLVELSDGERQGVGECAPLPDLSCDAIEDGRYEEILSRFCQRLCETGEIDYEAMRDYPSMLFGLETALRSFQFSHHSPLTSHLLFDTAFSRGEVGIPINGLVWMGNYEEMLQRMEEKLEKGFRCVKLKIGAIDFDK